MAQDVLQFLRKKFIDGLEEAEKGNVQLPCRSIFLEIKELLTEMDMTTLTGPNANDQAKDVLCDLNGTLAECRLVWEEPLRLHKMDKFGWHSIKQLWLNEKVKKKLQGTLSKLRSPSDSNNGGAVASYSPTDQIPSSVSISDGIYGFNDQLDDIKEGPRIYGFNDQIDNIKRLLKINSNARSGMTGIGIVGTGGSGKTTLASMVFNSKEVQEKFPVRISSSLKASRQSRTADIRMNIFKAILSGIGTNSTFKRMLKRLEEEPDDYLLDKYILQFQRFLLGKRYIILLDDVWDTSLWYGEDLNSPLDPDGRPYILSRGWLDKIGGTIMVTSRLDEVAKRVVGEKNLHHIQPISKEHCWSIFKDAVKGKESTVNADDQMILTMKEEIEDQCDGLPFAAHTIAKIIHEHMKKTDPSIQRVES
ncbi:hypothetical protein L1049_024498 [Liquidambar formosana]|uniref:NB-ARC domain-containing protein n=1 Tax=Liquidambar formosana TaxID=63359 RepID=A0AAP0WZN3_LIQFO